MVERGATVLHSLGDICDLPTFRRGLLGTTLTLNLASDEPLVLRGASHSDACRFAEQIKEAWVSFNLMALERDTPRIEKLFGALASLDRPLRYPAACTIGPLLNEAQKLEANLLSKLPTDLVDGDQTDRIQRIRQFVDQPSAIREQAVSAFVTDELSRYKEFLDTIESRPLTPEQRLAVVVDEDATLVLAGAGSGKTSVITAKAAYLLTSGIRASEEVLLLAFAKNAADEMSERVKVRSGVPITARTFHGLAYAIIGAVEGSKPPLATHATDDAAFLSSIKTILDDLVLTRPEVATTIIGWFAYFYSEAKSEWDFATKNAFYSHLSQQDLRTLQGEQVKSYEELQIANWLYINGIEYEYEPIYEHKVRGTGRRDYCPDFRLTESGVYIEHFGVRRETAQDGSDRLTTAPFIDREKYLADMTWKREVHASHGTVLIETYSYERQEGRLLTGLSEKLAAYTKLNPRSAETIYDRVVSLKQIDAFSRLVGTFLRKFKGGAYSTADCEAKAEHMNLGARARAFLEVFNHVFEEYQRRLGERIDFEDMVLRAAGYVETGKYVSPFRHILIDEFQDISQSRARLVKALKAQHPDVRVFAVGDDWQSIFRFAGSDIHVMRNFGTEFGGEFAGDTGIHQTIDLGRTFRSVDMIAFAARDFVLKNPSQISKQIIPAGEATGPAIEIVMTPPEGGGNTLSDVLAGLDGQCGPGETASVLLLGRYRFLEPDIQSLQRSFRSLKISYRTIHASKGLEADYVVLLNADSGRTGFPSEIVDDPLLAIVSPEEEMYPNAEERRVMYVAMTRARRSMTIIASGARPSSFVKELIEDPVYGIGMPIVGGQEKHDCADCGGRLLRVQTKNERAKFQCEHVGHCGNALPACPSCGLRLPRQAADSSEVRCGCGASYPQCPICSDGWLIERNGPFGSFLGCVRFPSCAGKGKGQRSAPN